MDTNNVPALDEYPLKYLFPIASLKDLALTSLALDLWYHNQLGHFRMQKSNYNDANFKCEQVLRTSLPGSVTKLINRRIRSMGRELQVLYSSFECIKIVNDNEEFLKFYDSFTYGPDGKMSSERSARNLLTRCELNNSKKSRIIGAYDFKGDDLALFIQTGDTSRDWREVQRIYSNYSVFRSRGMMDSLMNESLSEMMTICNWTVYLNFLNTLRIEQQHIVLGRLIKEYESECKYPLSKLNREQVDYILSNFPRKIISSLTMDEGCIEYALKIWEMVRNSMNAKQFFELLNFLCRNVYDRYKILEDIKCRSMQAQIVLHEIWITAPNRLKMEFLNETNMERFFTSLTGCYSALYQHSDHDGNFFCQLFTEIPIEMRSNLWYRHWREIVGQCPIQVLNHLLKLCLNDTDHIERFVKDEMLNLREVEEIIDDWFSYKFYEEMINYVKLCSWNENLVKDLRKKIFTWCISSQNSFIGLDELIKLGEAIDNSMSNVDEANDLKKTILFTVNVQKLLLVTLQKGLAKEAVNAIERFWSTERSEFEKQVFMNYWVYFLNFKSKRDKTLFPSRWKEFLSWWVGNENDVPMFKQCLPMNEIFVKVLTKSVSNLSSRLGPLKEEISQPVPSSIGKLEEFADMDDFLMWYFGNEKAIRSYKGKKIKNYRKMTKLHKLLSMNNECIVNHILAWFFNDNLIEIGRFKANFKK